MSWRWDRYRKSVGYVCMYVCTFTNRGSLKSGCPESVEGSKADTTGASGAAPDGLIVSADPTLTTESVIFIADFENAQHEELA
jgi:hypothetical protein